MIEHKRLFHIIKTKRNWRECQSNNKKLSAEWDWFEDNDCLYIIFQETNGLYDWKQNFSFTKRRYKQGDIKLKFHHGFYELYDLMKDEIVEIAKNTNKQIVVSGWSQGAAIAQIAVQDIYFHTGKKSILVSFGAPMAIYGKKTRDACREACFGAYEYCNRNDIVSYVPPFHGWYHINRIDVGDKFSLFKLFKPTVYHTNYDEVL